MRIVLATRGPHRISAAEIKFSAFHEVCQVMKFTEGVVDLMREWDLPLLVLWEIRVLIGR